jgi:pyruvate/2-oxoglutarate dehydrogenase complex dihydrolipoamide dehydrogenase (E3) component
MERIAICDGKAEGFAKVLTRTGSGKIIEAAIVHMHAGGLLAELTIAKKYGVPLSKLASTMHVYNAPITGAMPICCSARHPRCAGYSPRSLRG